MKHHLKQALFTHAAAAVLFLGAITAHAADGDHVFTVADGASPWSDWVGQWFPHGGFRDGNRFAGS